MHPAYSVIFFTTAAGAGYGLLALLGVFAAYRGLPPDRWLGAVGLGLALTLITAGLLASTKHLGHPERAWRAFSQWRSSWLSREGVMAILTYIPAGLFGIGWVFYGSHDGLWQWCAILSAMFAFLTVYATGMIYATLKPIHAWHNQHTVPVYLALALMTGALLFNMLAQLFGVATPPVAMVTVLAIFLAFYLKRRYWRFLELVPPPSTPESATGLGDFGTVRLLDPPNVQENFVQREMGYRIARKHALKLRRFAFLGLFVLPLALTLLAMETGPLVAIPATVLAAVSGAVGIVIERWLFFAEARHAVTLYYGAGSD